MRGVRSLAVLAAAALAVAAVPLAAQGVPEAPVLDSIVVEGNARVAPDQVIAAAGLRVGDRINYRDVQRAVQGLFATGQFDDVVIEQFEGVNGNTLVFRVTERPLLERWEVRGVAKLPAGDVRGRVKVAEGRPIDRSGIQAAKAAIDSLYRQRGYFAARTRVVEEAGATPGTRRVAFEIEEGGRVLVSQVVVDGNEEFPDGDVVEAMATKPEGFWWFRRGDYDEQRLEEDVRERLPRWYADRGYIDFQVLGDSLVPDSTTGKAVLHLRVLEGERYLVGDFDVVGNRRYSNDELRTFYPFGGGSPRIAELGARPFSRSRWDEATEAVRNLYANSGYIYSQVQVEETRRLRPDGTPVVDLKWVIREGQPAIINKVLIVGNDVTHERVIREAILLLPGQVFNRDLLLRSYQNIASLGFFQEPMPPPDVQPVGEGSDVDIIFRVTERRTGNINFGASLGQGTGVGGFIGLEEPNLFGRGKRGRLQWQFGANINDLQLSYSDPAIRETRFSGTISVFDSRARFIVGDLGRRRNTGFSLQFGWPLLNSRFTRLFTSYTLQRTQFSDASEDLQQAQFGCRSCTRSAVGVSVLRDTRVGMPFPTGGTYTNVGVEFNGGILGGDGDYRKIDLDSRWYTPIGTLGGGGKLGAGVQFVFGFAGRTGFIFGDARQFFTELYSLGGVQFGVPLRGYQEFSITPNGYDPNSGTARASPTAFGNSYIAFTTEVGARVSQALYFSTFLDAGNVYNQARQFNLNRLYRGAGFGVAIVSPLGPIGVDLAYGFDRTDLQGRPNPGWQLHFRLGNFF